MCLFEFDQEQAMKSEREEGKEEGRQQGREEGKLRLLIELVKEGIYTVEQASKKANITVEEFEKILAEN